MKERERVNEEFSEAGSTGGRAMWPTAASRAARSMGVGWRREPAGEQQVGGGGVAGVACRLQPRAGPYPPWNPQASFRGGIVPPSSSVLPVMPQVVDAFFFEKERIEKKKKIAALLEFFFLS